MTSEQLLQFVSKLDSKLYEAQNKVAEYTSLYSDTKLRICYTTAYEAIVAYLIAVYVGSSSREEYVLYKFTEEMASRCYKNNYQGKWELVQDFIELQPHTLYNILEFLEDHFSYCDLYGNILPLVEKLAKSLKVGRQRPNNGRVKKPQRRRGYNDKGTLRLNHEHHSLWTWSGPNEERLDRRSKISYPARPVFWTKKK